MTFSTLVVRAIAFIVFGVSSVAAEDRENVALSHDCAESTAGSAFVYELKESIRKSTQFKLNDEKKLGFGLSVICVDKSEKTVFMVIEIVYRTGGTPLPFSLGAFAHQCGAFVASACAAQAMAHLDDQLAVARELLAAKSEFDAELLADGAKQEFQECVTILTPDWKAIQANPRFQGYMAETHAGLGIPRGEALQDAIEARDAAATAAMYRYAGKELAEISKAKGQ